MQKGICLRAQIEQRFVCFFMRLNLCFTIIGQRKCPLCQQSPIMDIAISQCLPYLQGINLRYKRRAFSVLKVAHPLDNALGSTVARLTRH